MINQVGDQAQQQSGSSASGLRRRRGRLQTRRARLLVALGAGVVALLCLGGVGTAIAIYDNATEIPRADPNVVMANFLGSYLVNQNDQDATLYSCQDQRGLDKLKNFRDEIAKTEREHSVEIVVSWRNLVVQTSGSRSSAMVEIVRSVANGSAESFDPWTFELQDEHGWRVCSANPV